ncbi:hypothetical protein ABZ876_26010 [Streptomyces sp. NPDC046931]
MVHGAARTEGAARLELLSVIGTQDLTPGTPSYGGSDGSRTGPRPPFGAT